MKPKKTIKSKMPKAVLESPGVKTITTKAPKGYRGDLIVSIRIRRDYFSITGEISTAAERRKGDAQVCGCIHEQILQVFPQLKPFVDLHLAEVETGRPLHAYENGYYFAAGALGGIGEPYHAGNKKEAGKYSQEAQALLCEHLRVSKERGQIILKSMKEAAKAAFDNCAKEEEPRWAQEASSAVKLFSEL